MTPRARTPGQAAVVVVGHVLLLGAGDGVVVLQQRDGRLQRVRAGRGRVPRPIGVRVGRWRQQLQLARGLQEGGALADEALGRRAAGEVPCAPRSVWAALAATL